MNTKTFALIAVILTCMLTASASALIANSPSSQIGKKQTETPTSTPTLFSPLTSPSVSASGSNPHTSSTPSTSPSPSETPTPKPTTAQTASSSTPAPIAIQQITPPTSPTPQPHQTPAIVVTNITSLFNAELSYVYVGPTNSTGAGHDHFGFNITTYPQNYYPQKSYSSSHFSGAP